MSKKIIKALTWRAIGTGECFAVAFFTTGHIGAAGSIAGLTAVTSTILYVVHEYAYEIVARRRHS